MLFLDEIHRLPPEGQEMIFYFMDHGTYNGLVKQAKIVLRMFESLEQQELGNIPIQHYWRHLCSTYSDQYSNAGIWQSASG